MIRGSYIHDLSWICSVFALWYICDLKTLSAFHIFQEPCDLQIRLREPLTEDSGWEAFFETSVTILVETITWRGQVCKEKAQSASHSEFWLGSLFWDICDEPCRDHHLVWGGLHHL